jgi:prepilin signal peptidase PulO-like enzyme (type II secretory pathway)
MKAQGVFILNLLLALMGMLYLFALGFLVYVYRRLSRAQELIENLKVSVRMSNEHCEALALAVREAENECGHLAMALAEEQEKSRVSGCG